MSASLVGSEMCIRDSINAEYGSEKAKVDEPLQVEQKPLVISIEHFQNLVKLLMDDKYSKKLRDSATNVIEKLSKQIDNKSLLIQQLLAAVRENAGLIISHFDKFRIKLSNSAVKTHPTLFSSLFYNTFSFGTSLLALLNIINSRTLR
eukprot:TRINITY_DN7043_c0_g2_i1.p1 TRINITY_DN7043_c0_g2~~TRINITY_DN7043_c0_g2_i1.p1  ORF type:complete len:148 (+),score=53.07 TRINITY_DN7043_c0_g2_i1:1-444(+)